MPGSRLIILDRDGVINQDSDLYIKSPDEWIPIPGSPEAIAQLNQWGWRVVVCTNQSGIGRGLFGMDTLNAIHDKMIKTVAHAGGSIDAIFYCPHTNADECDCRKPKAGMLKEVAARYNVELADVPVVGDSLRDLQSALAVGAQPMLVLTGKGRKTKLDPALPPGTPVFADLAAVAKALTG